MRTSVNPKISHDVRQSALFRDMDDDTLSHIADKAVLHGYRNGQTLFLAGDTCRSLSIILSGCIYLYFISEEGHEVIFAELAPGDVIGDVELTLNCRHTANAMACGTTRVLTIDRAAYAEISRLPQMAKFLMRTFAHKLRNTLAFAESMALHPLETRLARLLINLGRLYGRKTRDGLIIDRPISQGRMGQLINASRPRVNAQLQAWKGEGLIDIHRSRVVITDGKSLQMLSREPDAEG